MAMGKEGPAISLSDEERAVPEIFSTPEFNLIETETRIGSQLDVVADIQQDQEWSDGSETTTKMPTLSAMETRELAHSVATLTEYAVKSSLLQEAVFDCENSALQKPSNGAYGHAIYDSFRRGACFSDEHSTYFELATPPTSFKGLVYSDSVEHRALCSPVSDDNQTTAVFGSTFSCSVGRGEQI